jgi:predicted ATPase/DNA-binding CsgD family transcriptional regulator
MTSNDGVIEPLTTRELDILRLIVAGLSNHEIGVQLFLSEGTVKWHNKHIFDKLDVRSRTEAIVKTQNLRLFHEPVIPSPDKPKYNLPSQSTAFIGRESELQEITGRICHPDCRLLTLIGAGGSGKTRLAIQSAAQLLPHFHDGVFFTPLEPISSPDQVIPAIAQACQLHSFKGVDPRQQLFDFLHQKELLLVLDNFEHLLEAKSEVLALLEQTRHVKIMMTSRIALHVPEEWVYTITGMAFPEQETIVDGDQFDAVRLFLACARRSGRKLSLLNDLPHIATICQLTQGMPLAIELATSWLRTLTCQEIAEELRIDTDLLTTPLHDLPERHQSMRRVFQHSWNLLTEKDRKTLSALSIFRGGFTSFALRTITRATLTDLARLIDHSLVQVTGDGRYDLHPLISQYLQEHLLASGEMPSIGAAHAAYFAEFLHVRRRDLMGGRQLAALNEIQAEFENVSAAWLWLIDHQDYANLEKVWEALQLYVFVRGGEHLFGHLRKLPLMADHHPVLVYLHCCLWDNTEDINYKLKIAEQHPDPRARAFALRVLGMIFSSRHEHTTALSYFSESLALFRQLGEDYYIASALSDVGDSYGLMGEKAKAKQLYEESSHICRHIGNRLILAFDLQQIGTQIFNDGDHALTEPYLREALAITQEFGNLVLMSVSTQFIGQLYYLDGDFDSARPFFQDSLAITEEMGGIWPQAFGFLTAYLANAEGDYQKAIALLAKSRAVFGFHYFAIMLINWAQSIANCGLAHWQLAQEHLYESLKIAVASDSIPWLFVNLPLAGLILWNNEKRDLAVEMMALAFTHPKSHQGWFVKSPLGEHALESMKSGLGERDFDQAWQRGTQRDLHETSAALLELFA